MGKPGRKKSTKTLMKTIQFRISAKDKNRIKWLAEQYAGGDVSRWLRHAALNASRRFLK
jgi:hypothetical protein